MDVPKRLKAVDQNGGKLSVDLSASLKNRYRNILKQGHIECPPPDEKSRKKGQRGRLKRLKARNLLERLEDYEQETLRFMDDPLVPFTNNRGENDIRMTKVHQKISVYFRLLPVDGWGQDILPNTQLSLDV